MIPHIFTKSGYRRATPEEIAEWLKAAQEHAEQVREEQQELNRWIAVQQARRAKRPLLWRLFDWLAGL